MGSRAPDFEGHSRQFFSPSRYPLGKRATFGYVKICTKSYGKKLALPTKMTKAKVAFSSPMWPLTYVTRTKFALGLKAANLAPRATFERAKARRKINHANFMSHGKNRPRINQPWSAGEFLEGEGEKMAYIPSLLVASYFARLAVDLC